MYYCDIVVVHGFSCVFANMHGELKKGMSYVGLHVFPAEICDSNKQPQKHRVN